MSPNFNGRPSASSPVFRTPFLVSFSAHDIDASFPSILEWISAIWTLPTCAMPRSRRSSSSSLPEAPPSASGQPANEPAASFMQPSIALSGGVPVPPPPPPPPLPLQESSINLVGDEAKRAYALQLAQCYTGAQLAALCQARNLPHSGAKAIQANRLANCANPPPLGAPTATRGVLKRISETRSLLEGFERWPQPQSYNLMDLEEAEIYAMGLGLLKRAK